MTCNMEGINSMSLEENMKSMKAPLDEWNWVFQLLHGEHVVKLEQTNAWFCAKSVDG